MNDRDIIIRNILRNKRGFKKTTLGGAKEEGGGVIYLILDNDLT